MSEKNSNRIKVLYIDDEEHNLKSFKATFRREFSVFVASSGKEGLELFVQNEPEIVITDQRMPEMTGIEFLEKLQKLNNAPVRILLTGYSDINAVIDAINKGHVYRYLSKPWDTDDLRNAILNSYEVYDLRKQNARLLEELDRANQQLEFLLRQKLLS